MGIRQKALEEVGSSTSMEIKPRPLVFIFTFLLPLCFSSILPIDETNQGNKARVAYALAKESSNLGACSERILSWSGWNGGLNGAILIHAKDEPDMDDWNVFLVFDKELEDFKCYDGEIDNTSGKTFKIRPKAWNAASKAGSRRQIGIGIKWAQNSGEPKLKSMVVNGIPYTCGDGDDTGDAEDLFEIEAEEGEEEEDREEPESSQEVVVPVEQVENVNSERGVYVSWPKKVMGLYVLLADDDHEGLSLRPFGNLAYTNGNKRPQMSSFSPLFILSPWTFHPLLPTWPKLEGQVLRVPFQRTLSFCSLLVATLIRLKSSLGIG